MQPTISWISIPVLGCPLKRCRYVVNDDVPRVRCCPRHGVPLRRRMAMVIQCPACETAHFEHGRYCVICGSPTWRFVPVDTRPAEKEPPA
jgi:hypothetical protein